MRSFLLVRHGRSLFNEAGVINGDPKQDRGLAEAGIAEAGSLAGQIAQFPLDLVVCSPFPRVLQTAELALAGRPVPQEVDPDLGDIRIGDLEGLTLAEYRAAAAHHDRTIAFPAGESLNDAARRYAAAFERICNREEQSILVVCHEIPVRYAANAAGGSSTFDAPLHDVANATPYLFDEPALRRAVSRLRLLASS